MKILFKNLQLFVRISLIHNGLISERCLANLSISHPQIIATFSVLIIA